MPLPTSLLTELSHRREAVYSGLSHVRTQEPLLGSEWADRYFYLSSESSGIEGKWKCLPYQIALANWICDDDIQEINVIKSARVGFTKLLMIGIGYGIEHKRRNQVIFQPTDGDAHDFSVDEIDTMIRDVRCVGDMLKVPPGTKSKWNTTEKKVFAGSILDIKGGKSGRNYRRMTKDCVFYDELDGFDSDIDGEGSPLELGDTRVQTSSFPKSVRGSTPRVKGISLIEKAIQNCKHVYYRFVPCPDCGELQRLEFANLHWPEGHPELARMVCKACGVEIDYGQFPDMDEKGRWQTLDGYYYVDSEDIFYNPNNEPTERPKRIGVHIWAAYSYFTTWADTAVKWHEATQEAKKGNANKLKTVINTRLAETWEEKGERIDAGRFGDERLEDYGETIPNDVLFLTFGADVQGGKNSRIEVEIVGWGIEEESWSLDYLVIPGDVTQQQPWDHLDEALTRRFTRDDGVQLPIHGGFVDAGYLPTQVFRFTGPRKARNVYASKGGNTKGAPLVNAGNWRGDRIRAIEYMVNSDHAKDLAMARLELHQPGPGYCHFPRHYGAEYFQQLTAEEKVLKRKHGVIVGHEWIKKRDRNEALDCRCLNIAALARFNPHLPAVKLRLEQEADRLRNGLPGSGRVVGGRRVRSGGLHA